MPFYDVVQQHIQTDELLAIDQALEALEKAVEHKKRNLTPIQKGHRGRRFRLSRCSFLPRQAQAHRRSSASGLLPTYSTMIR